jgi:hypothetical protein
MKLAAYVSTYVLELPQVIKLLLCLKSLKSKLLLNTVKIQLNTIKIKHGLKLCPKFLLFSLFFVQGKFWNQLFGMLCSLKMSRNVT